MMTRCSSTVVVTQSQAAGYGSKEEDSRDESELVDSLLEYTESLMKDSRNHLVAYSGGVDSSLVLALLQEVSTARDDCVVQAVLGISPAVSREQVEMARSVASHLDARLVEVHTKEGGDEMYIENAGQACLACKTHLYSTLEAVLDHTSRQADDGGSFSLYNGTNADDVQDPTRVGLVAARNFSVKSPLEFTTKAGVRRAARSLGLPNWNAAAAPCLRSRLALGVHATQQHLRMIEEAERHARSSLRHVLDESSNLRVRMLTQQRARVEVDQHIVPEATQHQPEWDETFRRMGFSSVDVSPFKSGSVATKKT